MTTFTILDEALLDHVAAGFQPAFKFKQRIVLVVERGLEARGYLPEGM